jgi:hypothetical protein
MRWSCELVAGHGTEGGNQARRGAALPRAGRVKSEDEHAQFRRKVKLARREIFLRYGSGGIDGFVPDTLNRCGSLCILTLALFVRGLDPFRRYEPVAARIAVRPQAANLERVDHRALLTAGETMDKRHAFAALSDRQARVAVVMRGAARLPLARPIPAAPECLGEFGGVHRHLTRQTAGSRSPP